MKNFLLPALLLVFISLNTTHLSAQNLPSDNDKTFEVMVSPFSSSPIAFDQLRFRAFQSSDMAYRLRGNLGYDSSRAGENQRSSQFQIEVAPGVEWHAFQYNRISMYYGGELRLMYATTRNQVNEDRTDRNTNSSGFFGIGVNALVGLDVHFLQRLYTGMEVGYGLQMVNFLDAEVAGETVSNDRRDISLGTFYYPRLRLGVRF